MLTHAFIFAMRECLPGGDRCGKVRRRSSRRKGSEEQGRDGKKTCYKPLFVSLLYCVAQVVFIGESQGGHVAAKLASIGDVDVLVLVSSLPDVMDIPMLIAKQVTVVVGWKVRYSHIANMHLSYTPLQQAKETLWGRREGAQAVVNQMGLRAYLADDVEGWHSSWTPYQVARLCRWATEWHAANPVAAIGGA